MKKARIVVLISGSGSNLQAIIDSTQQDGSYAKIVAVFSNRPDVKGLERAQTYGIPAITLNHQDFTDRVSFDRELRKCIDEYQPDLLVLAGFMRILTPEFVNHYLGKMVNIHPSLLPKYPGLHTHKRALEAGDSQHGTTVHFVTAELDGGPGIIQASVDIAADDTDETLAKRVLAKEHIIYPMVVEWFSQGRLRLSQGQCLFDNKPLSKPYQLGHQAPL